MPSIKSILLQTMVELGGGIFRAHWDADMTGIEPMVLFDSPKTKSTLGLPVSKVSAQAVREQIRKSDEAFETYAEKACTRVFSQFGRKEINEYKPEDTRALAGFADVHG